MDDYATYDVVDNSSIAYNDAIANSELFEGTSCDTDCYPDF